jgi:hypothetical protein
MSKIQVYIHTVFFCFFLSTDKSGLMSELNFFPINVDLHGCFFAFEKCFLKNYYSFKLFFCFDMFILK